MAACRLAVLSVDIDVQPAQELHRALGGALALLTLASFGVLLSRTLELSGGAWATLGPDMRLVLAVTHFGHVWLWRVPALAAAWAAWTSMRRRNPGPAWLLPLAVAVITLTRSETGHPADHGDFTLAVWIDWLHVLAAGTWVGSMFGMSLAVFPALLRVGATALTAPARIFQRLSTLSGAALAVLAACGVYNAVHQLGSITALWSTRYGMTLAAKLAIVLVMIAIGAHNRYVKLPRLRAAAGETARERSDACIIRTCARAVLAESLLGLAVIGATATLIHAMPPADAQAPYAMSAVSGTAGPIARSTAAR